MIRAGWRRTLGLLGWVGSLLGRGVVLGWWRRAAARRLAGRQLDTAARLLPERAADPICVPAAPVVPVEIAVTRTVVHVVLPAPPIVAAPRAMTPTGPATGARLRVMVVDDEPLVLDMLSRVLGRDHEVVALSCGRSAIEQVREGAWFDAIVSDVMMPNMTGIELLEELLRIAPTQAKRLIFLSGGVFTPDTRARLDALGTRQLEKPISMKDLRSAVLSLAPPLARDAAMTCDG